MRPTPVCARNEPGRPTIGRRRADRAGIRGLDSGAVANSLRNIAGLALLALCAGCHSFPQLGLQPMYHNPFPQLTKVAIAPFFNLSTEPSVDGRQFAEAYGNELQMIPGFEVVPVGVVERAMEAHSLTLDSAGQARELAQQLGVDAIVIGAVTDFTPYYPPRCGLQVEWYSANPYFHPIPPGYGLPWGTPEEKDIPAPLVMEAEMALAREQLKTQTPPFERELHETPLDENGQPMLKPFPQAPPAEQLPSEEAPAEDAADADAVSYQPGEDCPAGQDAPDAAAGGAEQGGAAEGAIDDAAGAEGAAPDIAANGATGGAFVPEGWPDDRGFFPPPPSAKLGPALPSNDPVLRHTRLYNGADGDFVNSLSNYYFFRNDERGSQFRGYLTRMPDFIRFCCHRHITEMISARGGVDEARVVWRWPTSR